MWQATANYRDLWRQLPSRIERHAKLRSFHTRRTWCSLQRLSDLFNADFLLCLWIDSNASFPRLTAASTRFGSAVQTKGFGVELVSARKRLIATWRSTRERKTPRLRRRLVSLAKEPSTALSQDAEVGVKWNVQRDVAQAICAVLWRKRHKGPLRSLGRLGCLSVIRLPQPSACQRSLVGVRPTIPVCTLV